MSEEEVSPQLKKTEIKTPFFEIPIYGSFNREDIVIVKTETTIEKPPEIEKIIDQNWQTYQQEIAGPNGKLENRPKFFLIDKQLKNGKIHLTVGDANFKDFVGAQDKEFIKNYPEFVPTMLTVGTTLVTSDGYLVLNERSQNVFQFRGWICVFGGSVEAEDLDEKGNINPFKAATKEISEEAGIDKGDVTEIRCLGLMNNPYTKIGDLMFRAETDLSRNEIEVKQKGKPLEEGRSLFVSFNPNEVSKKILQFSKIFESSSAATLVLLGREEFGENWFRFNLNRLNRRGEVYSKLNDKQKEELEKRLMARLAKF